MGQDDQQQAKSLEEAILELSQREQRWGVEGGAPQDAESVLPVLRFHIATHHYALPGEEVKEIIGPGKLTPLPGAPPYILGITVHRRQVVGVLDLDRFFYPERNLPTHPHERLVIVEYGQALVGINAGSRTTLEQWPARSFSAESLELLQPNIRPYARAMRDNPNDPDVILLLDIEKVLEDAALRG